MSPKTLFKDKTLVLAHRGHTRNAPENSLAAFEDAIALGVDGIELDVRVCASGEVVVFHDANLDRMTGRPGNVKLLKLPDIRRQPLLFNGQPGGQYIPTLEQVIETVRGKALLNVEIKSNGLPAGHRIEQKVVDILSRFDILDETIISSFNPLVLRRLKKTEPQSLIGFLIDKKMNLGNSELLFTKMAGAQAIHIEESLLTQALLEKIQQRGYACLVWTVNEPGRMAELHSWGLDGIITDQPELLLEITHLSR